jgi:hypothetical protein
MGCPALLLLLLLLLPLLVMVLGRPVESLSAVRLRGLLHALLLLLLRV